MDRCRRYVFIKEGKGWLQSDWLDAEVKVLDPNKYPYSWEQAKPPDKAAPAEQDK